MYYMDANLTYGEKAWRQLHKNTASNIEQVVETTPHKVAATYHSSWKLFKLDEPDIRDIAGEVGTNS